MRIGLIGVAGAGKDTAAKMLSDLTGIPVVSFAKPLHEAAIHIWGDKALNREDKEKEQIFGERSFEWFNDYHMALLTKINSKQNVITEGNLYKLLTLRDLFTDTTTGRIHETITPRKFMQLYGTEYWRSISPTVWVDLVCDEYDDCIVPGVRFANEAMIFDLLIVIKRDGVAPVSSHISEELAKQFKDLCEQKEPITHWFGGLAKDLVVLENNGTIDDLSLKIKQIAENL